MIRPGPDWGQAITEMFRLPENAECWRLPVGGYLLAVSIGGEPPAGTDEGWRAEYEITDCNGVALHERIRWAYQLASCGCAFADPLPNMNTATPYVLYRIHPAQTPVLTVTVTHLLIRETA